MKLQEKSRNLAIMGIFSAIIIIFALPVTPIGFIELPLINATILHIPVIIGSVLLGAKCGAVLGFVFGLGSLLRNTMMPGLISFVFSPFIQVPTTGSGSLLALIVCFVPRILVGIVPYFVYTGLKKLMKNKADILSLTVAGVSGSVTNTLLVTHLFYFLFRDAIAEARTLPLEAVYGFVLSVITGNGIPEAIAAGIIIPAVCIPILITQKKSNS